MSVLIVYSTIEGQTKKIAERMARVVEEAGHSTEVMAVREVPVLMAASAPEAVIIAASIHIGKHKQDVERFIGANLALLRSVPSAFVSVSMSAGSQERRAEAERYANALLTRARWEPTVVGVVAGALRYSNYGFFKRLMLRKIAGQSGLPTDTSRDWEFTDWRQVDGLAQAMTEALAQTALA